MLPKHVRSGDLHENVHCHHVNLRLVGHANHLQLRMDPSCRWSVVPVTWGIVEGEWHPHPIERWDKIIDGRMGQPQDHLADPLHLNVYNEFTNSCQEIKCCFCQSTRLGQYFQHALMLTQSSQNWQTNRVQSCKSPILCYLWFEIVGVPNFCGTCFDSFQPGIPGVTLLWIAVWTSTIESIQLLPYCIDKVGSQMVANLLDGHMS